MINIRKGVFETNSSSVHSLVIRKDSWFDNDCIDNTPYIIKGGYYGRTPQIPIESTEGKLNYIWTMVNNLWGLDWDAYKDEEGNWIPEEERTAHYVNGSRFKRWKRKLQKMFPKTQFIDIPAGNYNYGIDHPYGLEQFADDMENHPELLKYLLFSYSWIEVGGDEYANWPCLLDCPWEELVEINGGVDVIYIKGN